VDVSSATGPRHDPASFIIIIVVVVVIVVWSRAERILKLLLLPWGKQG
jgi:hypothetical protein